LRTATILGSIIVALSINGRHRSGIHRAFSHSFSTVLENVTRVRYSN
jgi:hypothetical protein